MSHFVEDGQMEVGVEAWRRGYNVRSEGTGNAVLRFLPGFDVGFDHQDQGDVEREWDSHEFFKLKGDVFHEIKCRVVIRKRGMADDLQSNVPCEGATKECGLQCGFRAASPRIGTEIERAHL